MLLSKSNKTKTAGVRSALAKTAILIVLNEGTGKLNTCTSVGIGANGCAYPLSNHIDEWSAYDPDTKQFIYQVSEEQIRIWIERRY